MIELEDLLRDAAPQVLGLLLRRYGSGQFDLCEDAVQEAMLAAHEQWQRDGLPDSPVGWLTTAARRRLIDRMRSDARRRDRETVDARLAHPLAEQAFTDQALTDQAYDDTLQVLMLCCHPGLPRSAQVALTLRAVGGLSTAQIARAYLLPEATIAQRITRAKAKIRDSATGLPSLGDPADRLDPVLTVLYLMFTEAHTASTGDALYDVDLSHEAIRLTEGVHRAVADHGETAGLLALLLLTDARRAARLDDHGRMVPLDEQDRTLWDRAMIERGATLLRQTLPGRPPSPYLIQASIAALHAEAPSAELTDWSEILALYQILERLTDNPVVALNRAIAAAMVDGPELGLRMIDDLGDRLPADDHRRLAVRAHLLERAGSSSARDGYLAAARQTDSIAERDYLRSRAQRLRA